MRSLGTLPAEAALREKQSLESFTNAGVLHGGLALQQATLAVMQQLHESETILTPSCPCHSCPTLALVRCTTRPGTEGVRKAWSRWQLWDETTVPEARCNICRHFE